MKKFVYWCLVALFILAFTGKPFPASDLIIRISFEDIAGDSCALYYAADQGGFTAEQNLISAIDHVEKRVEFRLDGSFEDHLTGLRLDWPDQTEQLLCVKNISLSSGGVIQKQYSPCRFFSQENVVLSNEIDISLVPSRDRAYFKTGAGDPYLILSDALTEEICSHFSHRALSRLCLCLFLVASYVLAKKKLFS